VGRERERKVTLLMLQKIQAKNEKGREKERESACALER
jgi:hypothetical protein